MSERVRAMDWSTTPLGAIESWPQSFKSVVSLVLTNPFPMSLWWGEDCIQIYNDAYIRLAGREHPKPLGQPARVTWADSWHSVATRIAKVYSEGDALESEAEVLVVDSSKALVHSHFRFAYSPVRVEQNRIGGVLISAQESSDPAQVARIRLEADDALHIQTQTLRTLSRVNVMLSGELEMETLVHTVTEAGLALSGAQMGAFYYDYSLDADAESFVLFTLEGASREAFNHFPMPRHSRSTFDTCFDSARAVRMDDVTGDGRFGESSPFFGTPLGHLAMRSYLAAPVIARTGKVLGGLFFGHAEAGVFDERAEHLIVGMARQAATAMDNARLYQSAKRNEEKFRAVTESSTDVIAFCDVKTRFGYISPSVQSVLGFTPAEFAKKTLFEHLPEAMVHKVRNDLSRLFFQPDSVIELSFALAHQDGTPRHVALKATNLLERAGIEGILLNLRDVTEHKLFEEHLIEAKDNAEQMTRLKSSLLANMSHEIRTPLTSMLAWASVLAQEVPEEHLEAVQTIERSGRRLTETLNSVLALAQLEGRVIEIEPETVNLSDEAADTVRALGALAAERGLVLEFRSAHPEAFARLDRALFQRILNNLIGNAIKFTETGSVTVVIEADEAEVHVRIEDTGIGIDEAFMPDLFGEFKQESTGLARSHEGSGLGLAITKRLVEVLEGRLEVESQKGQGSVFTVAFARLSEEDFAVTGAWPAVEKIDALGDWESEVAMSSVLLVEDNEAIRQVVHRQLARLYEVEAFGDAESALERARDRTFDVVLLDISLPGMDGLQALSKLRETSEHATCPIIAITGHALPGDEESFLRAGFSGYLSKPFSPGDLEALVRARLKQRKVVVS
ncbi:MAG: response regulator [Bradymonadaceae bacterium]|nr:response regulator [Lujinxingiaceae bacterium]